MVYMQEEEDGLGKALGKAVYGQCLLIDMLTHVTT